MSYSILSLKPPGRRLNRAASTVYNPLSAQKASPTPTPDYGQQLGGLLSNDVAPQFALGTPNGNNGGGAFTFTNAGSGAFKGPLTNPTLNSASGQTVNGVDLGSIDYTKDPMYQQAAAFYQSQIAQAQASSLAAEKQNLIRYGDPSLISKVLGDKADQDTLNAARDNSFSTVAELGRWNTRSLSGIDSTTNRNNLYFSSTRGRDRGLQQEDYVRQQTRTGNQLQDVLTGIAQSLLGQQSAAQAGLLGAAQTAYQNQLQLALAQSYNKGQAGAAPYGAWPGFLKQEGTAFGASPQSETLPWWKRGAWA